MFEELQSVVFSELVEHNSDVVTKSSPKGDVFASALESQLLIWRLETLDVCRKFLCDHAIESMGWSPDSELIYCCMRKGTTIQIWNLLVPTWRWKLIKSDLAIIDILWTPDSRHLLVVNEFHIKIKIWSTVSNTTAEFENAKSIKNCVSFSSCRQYLAVAERPGFEDKVGIYICETWELLKLFSVETKDLVGIYFSPCDLVIAVLEAFTEEFKVLFYSIDGRLLSKYCKTSLFGITSLSWHQNGKFIVLGSYCGEVTLLQGSYYQEQASCLYPETVDSEETVVYTQEVSEQNQPPAKDTSTNLQSLKVEKERPVIVPTLVTPSEKNKLKSINCGVQILQCSFDGEYIASICGNQPYVICIYDSNELKLRSIIIHQNKIKNVSWHAEKPILIICTGSSTLDLWMPSCCISILSPFKDELAISNAQWNSGRDSLILNGKEKSSILSLP